MKLNYSLIAVFFTAITSFLNFTTAFAESDNCLMAKADSVEYSVCGLQDVMFPSNNKLNIKGLGAGQKPLILIKYAPDVGETTETTGIVEPTAAAKWVPSGEWVNGKYDLDLIKPGVYFIHLRILNADGTTSKNMFMGQIRVLDASVYTQIVNNVFKNRFDVYNYDAAPVEWTSYSSERSKIKSITDLANKIKLTYPTVARYYNSNFKDIPQQDRIAIYALNAIANYWELEICILATKNPPTNQKDYFKSNVACCTDYALTLYGVLDILGYKPEVITMPGHVLTQVALSNGQTYIMDGTGNYFIEGSIEDIKEKQKTLKLNIINLTSMKEGKRVLVSDLRREFLSTIFVQYTSVGYDDFGYIKDPNKAWTMNHAKLLEIK